MDIQKHLDLRRVTLLGNLIQRQSHEVQRAFDSRPCKMYYNPRRIQFQCSLQHLCQSQGLLPMSPFAMSCHNLRTLSNLDARSCRQKQRGQLPHGRRPFDIGHIEACRSSLQNESWAKKKTSVCIEIEKVMKPWEREPSSLLAQSSRQAFDA